MGDPGNKARKNDDRPLYPRRHHGEEANIERDSPEGEGQPRGLGHNWSAAGTMGTSDDAERMEPKEKGQYRGKEQEP